MSELRSPQLPFGLQIERDRSFSTRFGLSVWAEAALSSGSIGGADQVLAAAAAAKDGSG